MISLPKFVALAHLLGALLLAVPPALPQNLPDLGDPSQVDLSPEQERQLGEQIMREIRADRSYLDDPELTDYLNGLGYRLAGGTGARQEFEFFAIRDSSINAFALPGGFIGVHTGLIMAAQSESEVASVLAHEIAHVTQRHLARMFQTQKTSQITSLVALAVAILAARSNAQISNAAMATAQAMNVQNQLNFTREHEREADRIGLQIIEGSGFDPRGMPAFFERLQRGTRLYETSAPAYLRTHPLTFERIADIQNRTLTLPYRQVADSTEFLLLRARLQADEGLPRESVRLFENNLAEKKYASEQAQRYGLVAALLRAKEPGRAVREATTLRKKFPSHPMVDNLAAQALLANNQRAAALEVYRAALKTNPEFRSLVYGYAGALMEDRQYEAALGFLSPRLQLQRGDPRLFQLQSQAYAGLGKRLAQHQSMAEAYVLQGNLTAAIDQLQTALKSGDGDFYQLSAAEARLRELRVLDASRRKKSEGDPPRQ
ncbi:MAG TPA: M48 family metalloprotease [Burkholderiales bacterium]|nr:M48 family metalloprotease [Burkholderiales bacterium]